jgi:hypothetical protein
MGEYKVKVYYYDEEDQEVIVALYSFATANDEREVVESENEEGEYDPLGNEWDIFKKTPEAKRRAERRERARAKKVAVLLNEPEKEDAEERARVDEEKQDRAREAEESARVEKEEQERAREVEESARVEKEEHERGGGARKS